MTWLRLLLPLLVVSWPLAASDVHPVPPQAQQRIAAVQLRLTPNHADWSYTVGQPASVRLQVFADQTEIPEAKVRLAFGPEMMPPTTEREVVVPVGGLEIPLGTLPTPGFLRCTATGRFNGRDYKGVTTVAFSPEKIVPTQTDPSDFDTFWRQVTDELARTPAETKLTLLPEASTSAVNVYHVSFRLPGGGWEAPSRFYGILCEPVAPGKYPALLRVPGAGVRPYKGDIGTAAKGVITFEVGIHGLPVNLPKEIYDQLLAGALNGYWHFNNDNRDTYYYRRVVQGCLRAVDVLAQRPLWNGQQLVVAGASQGGFLSLATAALEPRVTGLAVTHPALCDLTGPLQGRAGGWPHPFRTEGETAAFHATPAKIATSAYYDGVNFAKRVKVPGFYNWGYNDDVCPPTSVYAAYNVISAPKTLGLTLELAHSYTPEQWDAITAWVDRALGLTK